MELDPEVCYRAVQTRDTRFDGVKLLQKRVSKATPTPTPGPCLKGDVNGDGLVTVADAFYLDNYLNAGGPPPINSCSADMNGDGRQDVVFGTGGYLPGRGDGTFSDHVGGGTGGAGVRRRAQIADRGRATVGA